jgi:hypothetical protein
MTWVGSIGAWKTTEDAFLRRHYKEQGAKFCAENLTGRSISAIHRRVAKIGLATPNRIISEAALSRIDDTIRRAYTSERKRGFSGECAKRLGMSPRWVSERAIALGLVAGSGGSQWSEAEREFAEAQPMMPPKNLSIAMRKRGWRRTPTAIAAMRQAGLIAKDDPGFFSGASLAVAMGVDEKTVQRWIRSGMLAAKPRGTHRTESQGGDTFIIHEHDVARFIVENASSISLAKIEPNKAWFIDLMARCAAATFNGLRDKGQRIYALAKARPDLSHAQIADMMDSTPGAVSVTISKLRGAERLRVAA